MKVFWHAWATVTGIAVPLAVVWAVISNAIGDKPVSVHANQMLLTSKVQHGGTLEYKFSVDRKRPCPGYITDVYQRTSEPKSQTSSFGFGSRSQIVLSRAVVTSQVGYLAELKIASKLPEDIGPGQWHMTSSLVSKCPGLMWWWDEDRVDRIIELDFVVEPK